MPVTRADFIDAVLAKVDEFHRESNWRYPTIQTPIARLALLTLSVNEYGATSDFGAKFNLLDTTEPEPGSWAYNVNAGDPVRNYDSAEEGITATAATLCAGRYYAVVDDFMKTASSPKIEIAGAQNALATLQRCGWGSINLALVGQVQAAAEHYGALIVSGGADVSIDPPAPATSPAKPEQQEEPTMFLVTSPSTHGVFLVHGTRKQPVTAAEYPALQALGYPEKNLTQAELDALTEVPAGTI